MKKTVVKILLASFVLVSTVSCTKKTESTRVSKEYNLNGINAIIKDGKVQLSLEKGTFDPHLPDIGRKGIFEVTGLLDTAKDVFIGEYGNDYNPLLCILLENGNIQTLSIVSAYMDDNFMARDKIPTLNNIVSFESGMVEDDETGYYTIFAIDKDGIKHEIVIE